jgi:hypothetical protein
VLTAGLSNTSATVLKRRNLSPQINLRQCPTASWMMPHYPIRVKVAVKVIFDIPALEEAE